MESFDKKLHELESKVTYAKNFHPEKVAYYQSLVENRKSELNLN